MFLMLLMTLVVMKRSSCLTLDPLIAIAYRVRFQYFRAQLRRGGYIPVELRS